MRPLNRWFAVALLLVCFNACADDPLSTLAPQQLFDGLSEGNGSLRLLFGKPKQFHVESSGHIQPDGKFRLDQTVTFKGDEPAHRYWIIETLAPAKFAGTLSDAPGDVTGSSEGNRLTLRYRVKGPMIMKQTLEQLPDGKTIDNIGTITLLGIPIGRLHETIIRKHPIIHGTHDQ